MRNNVRAFVAAAAGAYQPPGPIFEFGSYLVPGQEVLANLRPLFPGQNYIGCDMRPGAGVDRVEDLAALNLKAEVAGAVICLDTLEHVFEVRKAIDEMLRILKPGGMFMMSVPLDFRIHHHPDDYWRLTPSCVARLLAPLAATVVGSQGVEGYPHTVLGLGYKSPVPTDFPHKTQQLIETFQSWCESQLQAMPSLQKLKRRLSLWVRSKGERRRIQAEFASRFAIHFNTTSAIDVRQQMEGLFTR